MYSSPLAGSRLLLASYFTCTVPTFGWCWLAEENRTVRVVALLTSTFCHLPVSVFIVATITIRTLEDARGPTTVTIHGRSHHDVCLIFDYMM